MLRNISSCLLLSLISAVCMAQNFRGAISGIVTDSSGAVVVSAAVIATDMGTGLTYKTISSSTGGFAISDLPLGSYTIVVSSPGFKTLKIDSIPVSAGKVYDLRPKLSVSSSATTVTVSAAALALETSSTALTDVVESKTVQNLPMNGRDFTQFLAMTPGFTGYPGQANGSINGSRDDQFNWQIDGADNNDPWLNLSSANQGGVNDIAGVTLPLDSIEEVSTQTQGSAEQGRNPAATTNLVIKSGTNQLHGSAYYYNRNEFFAVQAPFAPSGSPKAELRNQQYGGSLGGPIWKDKTFYFVNYEQQQFVIANAALSTEPSTAYQTAALQLLQQYNVSQLPAAQTLLNTLWPASSLTGPASPENYFSTGLTTGNSHNGLIKFDHSFNDKNRVSLEWFVGTGTQIAPIYDPSTGNLDVIPYYFTVAPDHVQNYNFIYNRIFSPNLTNQLLLGVNSFTQTFNDVNHSFDPVALGFNTGVTSPGLLGAPQICIGAFDCTGVQPPAGRQDITSQITDGVSYIKGAHQVHFGGEFRPTRVNDINQDGSRGQFTFDGTQGPWSGLLNTNADPNIPALADFMAGYIGPSAASIVAGNQLRLDHINFFSLFASDNWQVTPSLNLNYGLRWDYEGPPHTGQPNLSIFDPSVTGGLAVTGQQVPNIFPKYWKAVSPRAGFAYQPEAGMVIRGGVGFYYDTPAVYRFFDNGVSNGGGGGVKDNPAGSEPVFTLGPATTTITQNEPIFPMPSIAAVVAQGSTISLYTASQKLRPAYDISYNLNIQQSLSKNAILQIGYVGTLGRRLLNVYDINQATPNANGLDQTSRPYYSQFPNFSFINQITGASSSGYNGLQTVLKTQDWHGLVSQFSYVWSHALDNGTNGGHLPQNSYDPASEYGNSDFDARNNFKSEIVYTAPSFSHGPKLMTNGWELSSNMYFQTGLPLTIYASGDFSGTGEYADRANQVGSPFQGVSHSFNSAGIGWLNPNAFVNPNPGTYGTARRNQYSGPGYGAVDIAVLKNFPIKDRLHAQFRAEMFNVFNRVNLAPPSNTVGSGFETADTIGDYQGAPGIGPGEPFNTQFALKILW
jgi:hypothetical protein